MPPMLRALTATQTFSLSILPIIQFINEQNEPNL
jgi:hypothetical protein